eukprot:EG_transcript_23858
MGCCMKRMGLVPSKRDVSLRRRQEGPSRPSRRLSLILSNVLQGDARDEALGRLRRQPSDASCARASPRSDTEPRLTSRSATPPAGTGAEEALGAESPHALAALRRHKQAEAKQALVYEVLSLQAELQPAKMRSRQELLPLPLLTLKGLAADLEAERAHRQARAESLRHPKRVTPYATVALELGAGPTPAQPPGRKSAPPPLRDLSAGRLHTVAVEPDGAADADRVLSPASRTALGLPSPPSATASPHCPLP